MSPRIIDLVVKEEAGGSQLHVIIDRDPRSPGALLDGKTNEKALRQFFESVRGALDGSAPAPATPVTDHFVQKKDEVPWSDPEQDPAIELGAVSGLRAAYGL